VSVSIRSLHTMAEMETAQELLSDVWHSDSAQLDAATMRALAHAGNYVAGAFDGEPDEAGVMIGCAVGFFAAPSDRTLHSHIAGVRPALAGQGVGTALKHHQRTWCLQRGVTAITWTFDPAIARNAYFNLTKLGVTVLDYLEDFYGPLADDINAGLPTDRLLVRWDLGAPAGGAVDVSSATVALEIDAHDAPVERAVDPRAGVVLVEVPPDMEQLRQESPALGAAWRLTLRSVLSPYVAAAGWTVSGFLKRGAYVVSRHSDSAGSTVTSGSAR